MLLGTLGASLLKNLLTGKGITWAGGGAIKAGQDFVSSFILILKYKDIIEKDLIQEMTPLK